MMALRGGQVVMAGLRATVFVSLVICASLGESARILAVFPYPSVSHQVVYQALTRELAHRGHQMVVVTSNPIRVPPSVNYTQIDISSTYRLFRQNNFVSSRLAHRSRYETINFLYDTGNRVCEMVMANEQVRHMTSPNNTREYFDLVIIEWLYNSCFAVFSHRFSAPLIGIVSLPPIGVLYDSVGNPNNPSYMPESFLPYTEKNRTFFQRLVGLIFNIRFSYFFYNSIIPRQDAITKRFFGPSTPYIGDLQNQVSMLFINYIDFFHSPRPNVPAIVHVNGFHINPPKPLPKDIQQFLDSAPTGAIYFSLGSNVRSDQLPAEKRKMFLDAFAELPEYHVLWKWEANNLPGQSRNVKIGKWMPQQDILRHPKVKVFITQGGLQSTEEAIQMKVPMIGIPIFADQDYNTNLGQDRGITLRLELNEITKETLFQALKKVIEDKSYRENIERLSALVNDQPTTPMERAVWWTEYVLRHKGAKHLRSVAVDIPWYTYLLLDVVLFLLAVALLVVVLLFISIRFVLRNVKMHSTLKVKTK